MDEMLGERVSAIVSDELSHLPPTALVPAVLTRDEVRRPIRELLRPEFPNLLVLGYGDLPVHHNIQPIARLSLG